MQKFKSLPDAIALAEFAHRNQTDKAGLPYIEHPKRVLAKVQARGALPFVQQAAVLHDVTEDTAFNPQHLLDLGFSEATVRLVRLLDRDESEREYRRLVNARIMKDEARFSLASDFTKEDISAYYYLRIGEDENATLIKESDIEDNTERWRLSYLEPQTQERLKSKYEQARWLLSPYRNPLQGKFDTQN